MKAAPCRESWGKKCPSQSLLWLRLHCRADLCLPVQNGPCLQSGVSFFQKPQLEEISSSHTAIPAWACLFLLAFHSLSFISLTLKTFVHTRNCMHSSYTLSQVTCFQQDRLLLYFSFLAYWKLFPYVNFFFVVVAFPPPAGGTVKHGVLSSFGTRSNSVEGYLITLASWQCSILDNLYFSVGSSYMWVLAHIPPPAHNLPWLARFCLVPVNSPASFRGRDGRWWRRKSSSLLDQQVSLGNAY